MNKFEPVSATLNGTGSRGSSAGDAARSTSQKNVASNVVLKSRKEYRNNANSINNGTFESVRKSTNDSCEKTVSRKHNERFKVETNNDAFQNINGLNKNIKPLTYNAIESKPHLTQSSEAQLKPISNVAESIYEEMCNVDDKRKNRTAFTAAVKNKDVVVIDADDADVVNGNGYRAQSGIKEGNINNSNSKVNGKAHDEDDVLKPSAVKYNIDDFSNVIHEHLKERPNFTNTVNGLNGLKGSNIKMGNVGSRQRQLKFVISDKVSGNVTGLSYRHNECASNTQHDDYIYDDVYDYENTRKIDEAVFNKLLGEYTDLPNKDVNLSEGTANKNVDFKKIPPAYDGDDSVKCCVTSHTVVNTVANDTLNNFNDVEVTQPCRSDSVAGYVTAGTSYKEENHGPTPGRYTTSARNRDSVGRDERKSRESYHGGVFPEQGIINCNNKRGNTNITADGVHLKNNVNIANEKSVDKNSPHKWNSTPYIVMDVNTKSTREEEVESSGKMINYRPSDNVRDCATVIPQVNGINTSIGSNRVNSRSFDQHEHVNDPSGEYGNEVERDKEDSDHLHITQERAVKRKDSENTPDPHGQSRNSNSDIFRRSWLKLTKKPIIVKGGDSSSKHASANVNRRVYSSDFDADDHVNLIDSYSTSDLDTDDHVNLIDLFDVLEYENLRLAEQNAKTCHDIHTSGEFVKDSETSLLGENINDCNLRNIIVTVETSDHSTGVVELRNLKNLESVSSSTGTTAIQNSDDFVDCLGPDNVSVASDVTVGSLREHAQKKNDKQCEQTKRSDVFAVVSSNKRRKVDRRWSDSPLRKHSDMSVSNRQNRSLSASNGALPTQTRNRVKVKRRAPVPPAKIDSFFIKQTKETTDLKVTGEITNNAHNSTAKVEDFHKDVEYENVSVYPITIEAPFVKSEACSDTATSQAYDDVMSQQGANPATALSTTNNSIYEDVIIPNPSSAFILDIPNPTTYNTIIKNETKTKTKFFKNPFSKLKKAFASKNMTSSKKTSNTEVAQLDVVTNVEPVYSTVQLPTNTVTSPPQEITPVLSTQRTINAAVSVEDRTAMPNNEWINANVMDEVHTNPQTLTTWRSVDNMHITDIKQKVKKEMKRNARRHGKQRSADDEMDVRRGRIHRKHDNGEKRQRKRSPSSDDEVRPPRHHHHHRSRHHRRDVTNDVVHDPLRQNRKHDDHVYSTPKRSPHIQNPHHPHQTTRMQKQQPHNAERPRYLPYNNQPTMQQQQSPPHRQQALLPQNHIHHPQNYQLEQYFKSLQDYQTDPITLNKTLSPLTRDNLNEFSIKEHELAESLWEKVYKQLLLDLEDDDNLEDDGDETETAPVKYDEGYSSVRSSQSSRLEPPDILMPALHAHETSSRPNIRIDITPGDDIVMRFSDWNLGQSKSSQAAITRQNEIQSYSRIKAPADRSPPVTSTPEVQPRLSNPISTIKLQSTEKVWRPTTSFC